MEKTHTSQKNWYSAFVAWIGFPFEEMKTIKVGVLIIVIAAAIIGLFSFIVSYLHSPNERNVAASTEWNLVKSTTDRGKILDYIAEYNDGPFFELARERLRIADEWLRIRATDSLDELKEFRRRHADPPFRQLAAERTKLLQDHAAWKDAQRDGSAEAYRSYLSFWSDGQHQQAAKDKLRELDDADWSAARAENSVEAVEGYLRKWRVGKSVPEAKHRLAQLQERRSWDDAQSRDSIGSYDSYLGNWPTGRHVAQAKARIAELQEVQAWQTAEKANSPSAYRKYLANWQSGPHRREARAHLRELDKAAWQEADKAGSLQSYQAYMESWPDGSYRRKATARIDQLKDDDAWREALSFDSVLGYRSYLEEPGNTRHKAEALDKLSALDDTAWQLAERENELRSYRQYMENWQRGRHRGQARRKIRDYDQQAWKRALKTNTVRSYRSYLASWPNGEHVANAKTKTARLLNPPPTNCDRLAANPADPKKAKGVFGTPLKYINAGQAIRECSYANRRYPNVARFRYQLARAFHKNGQGYLAAPMYLGLISEGYVAAFDNIGWLHISGNGVPKNKERAIQYFVQGSSYGSTEAMTSLGEIYLHAKDYDKAREWFEKAKNLGNIEAAQRIEDMNKKVEFNIHPKLQEFGFSLFDRAIDKIVEKHIKK